jgi:NarL family two-component system response regulator LiaR
VLADAHPLFCEALERTVRSWPEFELLAVCHGGKDVLEVLERVSPAVLLCDPRSIAVPAGELISRAGESTRLVVVTIDPSPEDVYDMLAAGVAGCLGKDCSAREVCHALNAAARGDATLGESIQPVLAQELRLRRAGTREFLTERELEVLKLMMEDLSAPEIGERLEIGTATVKTHQSHIYERLGVAGAKGALVQAMRSGLIE